MDPHPISDLNPVSPKLVTARYLVYAIVFSVLIIACVVCGIFLGWGFYIPAAILFIWAIIELAVVRFQVKRLGWKEAEHELLISRGRWWHTFTVVPYGRIQFVDVTAGPIDRLFGLKKVELKTASASTDASIPGLPAAEADGLRERLAFQARERMSGL